MNPRFRGPLAVLAVTLAGGTALFAARAPTPAITPSEASTWSFQPPPDEFRADALLDLRSLNEKVAGETGFVHLDANGSFVRGDGQPIRFWAVNSDVARRPFVAAPLGPASAPDLARHARFLAKRGVNMVRQHRQLSPNLATHPNAAITDIDEAERDAIWRMVAAMRKEGIYSTISPYWAVPMKFAKDWGIAGGADQSALGLLFFDPTLQAAYKVWLKKLLAETNPYTGIALAQDASVAIIQIQNEDSLLFWSATGIKGPQRQALEMRFGNFLARKYGSIAKAAAAWRGDHAAGDAPADGRVALLPVWELTQVRSGGRAKRLADQTEFFARTMFEFNRSIVEYLRHDIGAKQLVNAGNWRTASAERLNDAERWSYTAGEVDAVNHYTGGVHQGPNEGWAIVDGDRFVSDSVLLNPRESPLNLRQTAGRPMLVTEGGWVMPNGFAAEGPFLVSAYSSLTGIAGYYWFDTEDEGFTQPRSANGTLPSQAKWLFATPEMLGSFPAAALAYRRGYQRRGAPALIEHRALQDVWDRKTPMLVEDPGFDPNRDAPDARTVGAATRAPWQAFLVGPVSVAFGEAGPLSSGPFAGLIEPARTRANTGEIVLDQAKGFCTVDAPRVQGVAAHFAHATTHQLSDVRFTSGNAFGAALAVSLDGAPLRTSRRILVQYATQSRPTGWQEAPARVDVQGRGTMAGMEVRRIGHAPWQVVRAQLDVVIANPGLTRARVLDMNGMAVATVPLERSPTQVAFRFPDAAMYVVVE